MTDYELLTNVAYYIKENPSARVLVTFKFRELMDKWIHQFIEYAKTVSIPTKSQSLHQWRPTIVCGDARIVLSVFPFETHEWLYGWEFNTTFGYHQFIEYQLFNINHRVRETQKDTTNE